MLRVLPPHRHETLETAVLALVSTTAWSFIPKSDEQLFPVMDFIDQSKNDPGDLRGHVSVMCSLH
jgi:hypothetical protein